MNKRALISSGVLLVAVVGLVSLSLRKDKTQTSSELSNCPAYRDVYASANLTTKVLSVLDNSTVAFEDCSQNALGKSNVTVSVINISGQQVYSAPIALNNTVNFEQFKPDGTIKSNTQSVDEVFLKIKIPNSLNLTSTTIRLIDTATGEIIAAGPWLLGVGL